ncbi:MAG TPA: NUDIX hydrolase [Rhabdochlamydiaceae bacterium]|jgi:8-oxo-dGTP pyrophosphatase MutT (NUDIX family)
MSCLEIELHEKKPPGFSSTVEVAACYLERENKLLLLKRSLTSSEPGRWGVPAGKLEKGETPQQGAIRELFEETGIALDSSSKIQPLISLYACKPSGNFVYHMFKVQLDRTPSICLSAEHLEHLWASPADIEILPLMPGAKESIGYYRRASRNARASTSVNAYLVLREEDKVLLSLRKNTGYCDGMWSLVAGHVEENESATPALMREAREEAGIALSPSQMQVVHVMHRKSDRVNLDIFFNCRAWRGAIQNLEPEKCEQLTFFPSNALPSNTIDYIALAFKHMDRGIFYSEFGWN